VGCVWVSYKSIPTKGQPLVHPLQSWGDIGTYRFPELAFERRFGNVDSAVRALRRTGKYVIGWLDAGIWERLHFLRGFTEAITDLFAHRDRTHRLLGTLTGFNVGLIKAYSELGVDCVGFTEDWGTQSGLQVRPEVWVEVFKPYYARIFEEARKGGLHTYVHSCGNIYDIIGHWIEVGLNVVQIDAPRQVGLEKLSAFTGKICFNCCIDIQKVLVRGIKSEIYSEAKEMIETLACDQGGFIARQYPKLVHIMVTPETHEIAYNAFLKYGKLRSRN